MSVTIDSLELKITHDSADAVKGVNALVRALRRLKEVAGMGADLVEVAKAIRVIKQATGKSNIASGTVSAMKQIKQATNDATMACDAHVRAWEHYLDVQDRIKDMKVFDGNAPSGENHYVQREVQLQGSSMTDASYWSGWKEYMDSFKTAKQLAAEAKEQAKQQKAEEKAITEEANRRHKVEDQIVKDYEKQQANAQKVQQKEAKQAYKDSVKKQTEDIKNANKEYAQVMSMFSKFGGIAMKLGGKVMSAITAPFRKAFEGYKRLVNMVKRMILRRLIMAALRTITDGFKTGLENLYQYSYAINGIDASHAYQSLDKLASISMYVKNSVGAAAMPIINIFIPALQKLASWAVMATNAINQLVSAFTGGDTYTKAKEAAVDYMDGVKDSASGANKAAKDLKATLLGFDEINRLDATDKGSGSGGGGGGSAKIDYRDYFEPAKIDPVIKDLADQIKKKIKAGDWEGIGKLIATKLNEAIAKIDAKAIGKKITTVISNGAKLVAGFLKSTDFKQIGSKIGDFLDGAIDGIDAKAFADTISGVLTGTIDVMLGWIRSAATNGTGSKVATRLYIFLKTALANIKTYLKDTEWDEVGNQLFQILDDFVKDFDFSDISNDFWNTLGHVWVASNTLQANFIAPAVNKWLTSIKDEFDSAKSKGEFDDIGWKIIKGVFGVFGPIQILWAASSFYSNVVVPWLGGIGESLDGKDGKKKVEELSDKILTTIFEGISQAFAVLTYPLADIGIGILQAIFGFSDSDRHKLSVFVMKAIKEVLTAAVNILLGDTALGQLGRKVISNFFDPIIGKTNTLNNTLQSVYNNMKRMSTITVARGGSSGNTVAQANGALPGYYTQMKAEGGYVGAGQLFIANEAGPELVGTVNGRTAVAPNAEITGIANAVYATGEREVAAINNLIRALNAKDMTAVVTADSIVAGLARKNRRDGVSTVPVSV